MAYRSHSARVRGAIKAAARSWTPFTSIPITDAMKSEHPHLNNCSAIFANSRYQAEVFECSSHVGGVCQVVIRRHLSGNEPIAWDDLQRAVHELYGPHVTAVEVYPPVAQEWRINREVRVLWVLAESYQLPVGLHLDGAWGWRSDA